MQAQIPPVFTTTDLKPWDGVGNDYVFQKSVATQKIEQAIYAQRIAMQKFLKSDPFDPIHDSFKPIDFNLKEYPFKKGILSSNEHYFSGKLDIDGIGERYGTWTNKGNISFIGPKYNYQVVTPNQKGELMTGLGLGLLSYNAENSINSSSFSEQKGGTFGILAAASYYHFIAKNIAIGARIGYLAGTLSKIKTTVNGNTTEVKLDDNEKEALSQVNFNAGLRVHF